jgi:hypothetical protein
MNLYYFFLDLSGFDLLLSAFRPFFKFEKTHSTGCQIFFWLYFETAYLISFVCLNKNQHTFRNKIAGSFCLQKIYLKQKLKVASVICHQPFRYENNDSVSYPYRSGYDTNTKWKLEISYPRVRSRIQKFFFAQQNIPN